MPAVTGQIRDSPYRGHILPPDEYIVTVNHCPGLISRPGSTMYWLPQCFRDLDVDSFMHSPLISLFGLLHKPIDLCPELICLLLVSGMHRFLLYQVAQPPFHRGAMPKMSRRVAIRDSYSPVHSSVSCRLIFLLARHLI
jgi:hypothetical protein